ncbi:hypothetical protein [Rhodopseudomonas sp. RCAM05734]|uniref:hypothetical protein n=1 Tax=Rhodopseudomonas sp. RCAM05734 TaxID=3457549 RepID=UPI004044E6B1
MTAVPAPPLAARSGNVVARYWRGEYSLGRTFWAFGLAGTVTLGVLINLLAQVAGTDRAYDPRAIFGGLFGVWLLIVVFTIGHATAVWRSANRYVVQRRAQGRRAGWGLLAKLAILPGVALTVAGIATIGAPQLYEVSRMAFMGDPDIAGYTIRVMRNGTEAEISGGIKYGLTDDLRKVLGASPHIGVIHLNSLGGRIGEAIKLNRLIDRRGLDTYVAASCYSACTLIFAAGKNRILRQGAALGFHAPSFPGLSRQNVASATADQKLLFAAAGFEGRFVEHALSIPNDRLWKPSVAALAKARVITRVSDGEDFASSGLGADVSKEQIGAILTRGLPYLDALKSRFPADYEGLVGGYYANYLDGDSEAVSNAAMRSRLLSIISRLRLLADDAVLVDLGRLYADEYAALGGKDPTLCYQYASGSGSKTSFADDLPAAFAGQQNDIDRRAVETAAKRDDALPAELAKSWNALGKRIAAQGIGDDQVKLLNSDKVAPAQHAEYCRVQTIFYREIATMPEKEAALLMRAVLQDR